MSATTSHDNEVEFLLDGEEFFPAFDALVSAVVAAAPAADTYVRLAYWAADPACALGDPNAGAPQLLARLQAAATAGHQVDIILYAAWEAQVVHGRVGDVLRIAGDVVRNQVIQQADAMVAGAVAFQNQVNLINAGLGGAGVPIRIYLEPINRWVPGASNHEKILIASLAGQRTCLIGGFNLSSGYYDVIAHDQAAFDPQHWHDTAMRIRGPATDAIEAEWVRRWTKSGQPLAANATPQTTYNAPDSGAVEVTIATTNAEGWIRQTDIQARLVREIAAAQRYIYLENYGLTDATLVDALIARMTGDAPPILIVNLNNRWPAAEAMFKWFNYISWVKIALMTCTSCDVPNPAAAGNLTLTRATAIRWRLSQSWNFWSTWRSISGAVYNRNLENDALEWTLPTGQSGSTPLRDIISVDGGVRFYGPTAGGLAPVTNVYLHSKLALFDDRVAMVGTANLTFRSMVYDGEIVAFINDARVAGEIRTRLFSHWNPSLPIDPDNWDAIATVNALAAPNTTYVRPLTIADLSQNPPNFPLGFTWA